MNFTEQYRLLKKDEVIQDGDEFLKDGYGWDSPGKWVPATDIGGTAPDPQYPSHRIYRRKVYAAEIKRY